MSARSLKVDKNIIFLVIILLVLVITSAVFFFAMRTDPVKEALSGDNLLKVLVVLEDQGKPLSTHIIAYYPASKRAAMFDIPGETGLILSTLGRVDRIDAVYTEKGLDLYRQEIEKITGIDVPFQIELELDGFARLSDLLGGFNVFIPTPVDFSTEKGDRVLLPSGAVTLDGDKLRTYVTYADPGSETSLETFSGDAGGAERRQRAVLAFFSALGEAAPGIFKGQLFSVVRSAVNSNVPDSSLPELLTQLSSIDSERLMPQGVTGSYRVVDGQSLLFPFYDGQLLKDIVRQTIAGLTSKDTTVQERVYALEILNGTKTQGLATNTSSLYQNFGYDVVRVGNAEMNEYEKTVIVDRIGNPSVAQAVAKVIQCENIQQTDVQPVAADDYATEAVMDFTIILGRDFDGRYVR